MGIYDKTLLLLFYFHSSSSLYVNWSTSQGLTLVLNLIRRVYEKRIQLSVLLSFDLQFTDQINRIRAENLIMGRYSMYCVRLNVYAWVTAHKYTLNVT